MESASRAAAAAKIFARSGTEIWKAMELPLLLCSVSVASSKMYACTPRAVGVWVVSQRCVSRAHVFRMPLYTRGAARR